MTNQPKILVVEDDKDLAKNIARFLNFAQVELSFDGFDGFELAASKAFDLIILDIMLPQKNGYDILKDLRVKFVTTPVIFLTAKDTLSDKLHGFNIGADDYLTKPFHREELIVRVKAILKREGKLLSEDSLHIGNLIVDINQHIVQIENVPIKLNTKEFDILVYLLQNKNMIITKEQLFDRIWGFDSETGLTVVEVYMSNLRKKLKATTGFTIQTLRNVGYLLKSETKSS